MLNFCEYIHEKTVNDLVKNCADIDLLSVIEKAKIIIATATTNDDVPIDIPVTFVSPCHNIASVAPPKPAPIASVIPYADIIDPITIISVFVAYFLNFILSPTKK